MVAGRFQDDIAKMQVPALLLLPLGRIDAFRGAWETRPVLKRDRLAALEAGSRREAIHAALRLDGIVPPQGQASRGPEDFEKAKDSYDVAYKAYSSLLDITLAEHRRETMSAALIRELHQLLLEQRGGDGVHSGSYRSGQLVVLPGSKLRHLAYIDAGEIHPAVRDLVAWYNKETVVQPRYHPLFAIAVFVARFLDISPFRSGNGRLVFLLTRLLLVNAGYGFAAWTELERFLEESLFPGFVKGREEEPWAIGRLNTFLALLDGLELAIARLNAWSEADRNAPDELPDLSRRILAVSKTRQRITCKDAVEHTGANRNTVKYHLRSLVERGLLRQHGAGRSVWYMPC